MKILMKFITPARIALSADMMKNLEHTSAGDHARVLIQNNLRVTILSWMTIKVCEGVNYVIRSCEKSIGIGGKIQII